MERLDAAQASVAVRVRGAVCADHADAPPHDLPPDTPVQLDLLASLLRQAP